MKFMDKLLIKSNKISLLVSKSSNRTVTKYMQHIKQTNMKQHKNTRVNDTKKAYRIDVIYHMALPLSVIPYTENYYVRGVSKTFVH